MFEEFYEKVSKKEPKKMVTLEFTGLSASSLKDKLANIDNIPEAELYDLIKDNYKVIFDQLFVNKDASFLDIITNNKFLSILIQVMNNVQIGYEEKIYCNNIVYDYFMIQREDNEDIKYKKQLMLSLSKTVNKDVIPSLLGCGIPEELSVQLALARFSTRKENIAIKRVNFIIISSSLSILNEQKIVWIYELLFRNITTLFEGIMFDTADKFSLQPEEDELYSTITLAILDILEDLPFDMIYSVIKNYSLDVGLLSNYDVRASLRCLSNDYCRINQMVAKLLYEGVMVP